MATILTLDDSQAICDAMHAILSQDGHAVTVTRSASEALKVAAEEQFDLIVTDLNMPEMSGNDFVKAIRQLKGYEFTPILMVTTERNESRKQEAKTAGATGWLRKPFTSQTLVSTVQKLVA